MSYDLFFHRKPGTAEVSSQSLATYFAGRANYEVHEGQAWYSNEDTGIYFSFDWSKPTAEEIEQFKQIANGDDLGERQYDAAFNINYCRPHPFGIEAEPEVSAFVEYFDFDIEDPQTDGMQGRTYSAQGFIDAWNAGNRFSYSVLNSEDAAEMTVLALPSHQLQSIWKWNYARKQLQDSMTDDVFVPMIMFCLYRGEIKTLVSWPDAIPIALPPVDMMILGREEIGHKLGFLGKQPGIAIVTYDAVKPHLEPFPLAQGTLAYRRLFYEDHPQELVDFFNAQPDMEDKPEIIGFDQILDQEVVQDVTRTVS